MPQGLTPAVDNPLSLTTLLINIALGIPLSLLLRWHFQRFGSTLSNREEFAQVFPFVLLTTILIISVVKSSLALSLGLVGALSIVRFRTPVKEPEELAYLFISIAMGLGLGADQTMPTLVAGLSILAVMAVLKWTRREARSRNLYLSLDWRSAGDDDSRRSLDRLNETITRHASAADLKRLDVRKDTLEATYLLDIAGTAKLNELVADLRRTFPSIGVTFLDQNQLPSV